MEILEDLKSSVQFAADHHVYKFLSETPHSSISIVGWEPGQVSPIHSHPDADEIYYVIEGEGLFNDGRATCLRCQLPVEPSSLPADRRSNSQAAKHRIWTWNLSRPGLSPSRAN